MLEKMVYVAARITLLLIVVICFTLPAWALDATVEEMAESREWATAKFQGVAPDAVPRAELTVVADHYKLQQNLTWTGKPIKIGESVYKSGLSCHAKSFITVKLPGPGKQFRSVIGVDNNDWSSRGCGSVVFIVRVDGAVAFKSEVLRGGMPGIPISVDLGRAKEFEIEVADAGDGIECDYADWADAAVTLADGRVIKLGGEACGNYNTDPPFSFNYGGEHSTKLLGSWDVKRGSREMDAQRIEHTLTYTDPKTGLVIRCVGVEYRDFPTVEWTVYFKNTGDSATPVLSDIQALDAAFERGDTGEFTLHHHIGSVASPDDYRPIETVLAPNEEKTVATSGGRSSNSNMPYFNVERFGGGIIAVVGWPGQWAARFTRDAGKALRVRCGQELTHFSLMPGEEVRSPLIVLQFWNGDRTRSQNIWRRWMLAHNVPRLSGKLPRPLWNATGSAQYADMIYANEANQKLFIDRYLEERMNIDHWWMDFGWFVYKGPDARYEADRERFPNGIRAITDHGRSKGVKSIAWFEPEHPGPGWRVYNEHPEWLLGKAIIDLGNQEAWKWMVEMVDEQIVKEGIDLYRQDFNIDPLEYWRATDSPDRQGITEIKYVTGLIAFWDELRRRHPNMLIDSCASGGKRNDLEMMRRAVPLWRSDYNNLGFVVFDYRIAPTEAQPIGYQCHTYGLATWLPYFGNAARDPDPYTFRSNMAPSILTMWDLNNKALDYDMLRKLTGQWREVADCYLGDYYPLTSYSQANDAWLAWQFDLPDQGRGVVQAFRREKSPTESARFRINSLDPDADYDVKDLDQRKSRRFKGRYLMEQGLVVSIPGQPGAVVITYTKHNRRRQ